MVSLFLYLTGLKLYEKMGLARNGIRKQRRDFIAFEKFIGQVFFQSDDLQIVSHQSVKPENRHIKVKFINPTNTKHKLLYANGFQRYRRVIMWRF